MFSCRFKSLCIANVPRRQRVGFKRRNDVALVFSLVLALQLFKELDQFCFFSALIANCGFQQFFTFKFTDSYHQKSP